MIIRKEQMEAFDRLPFQNFENEAIEHARKFAPKHCEVLSEDTTRTAVRAGIQRAGRYAFTGRGPVNLFLDLMFLLGSEFDNDPHTFGPTPSSPTDNRWSGRASGPRTFHRVSR